MIPLLCWLERASECNGVLMTMRLPFLLAVLLVNSLWINSVTANPLVTVVMAGENFQLEYVADPESRRQGLMGRDSLESNAGMLFDFPEGTQPQIWMRNMHISLDLLFVDNRGQVVDIYQQVPPCSRMPCPVYSASRPLRFVIEVPSGTVDNLGLIKGMHLVMPDIAQQSAPSY
ncbi:MAG: DUF192 domain-containing protein [Pseudomonadaceae bacterium]|nr:MAG: DUF192 domain-containing protein [Pseudomonadaceae bacterium]